MLDFSLAPVIPKFTGMWDVESAGDEWTGDNAFFYSFSLYCRQVSNEPFDGAAFCEGKDTGDYENDNQETVSCNNDLLGGNWVKLFDQLDEAAQTGDQAEARPSLPRWYIQSDPGAYNQYLWVDEGTQIDYAVGSGSWHSDGYDAEKHFFVTQDQGNWKIRNRGKDQTWSYSNNCNPILHY